MPRQASYSGLSNRPVVSNRPTKNNSSIKKNIVIKTSTAADKKADKKKSSSKNKNDNKKNTAAAKTETKENKSDADKLAVIKGNGRFRTSGGLDGKIITLDAGHGGSDPGAIGSDGTKEKILLCQLPKCLRKSWKIKVPRSI